jgi:hypothetical protein
MLRRKQFFRFPDMLKCVVLLFIATLTAEAQETTKQRFEWGLSSGLESHSLGGITDRRPNPGTTVDFGRADAGFSVGWFGQWPLGKYWNLRSQVVYAANRNVLRLQYNGEPIRTTPYQFRDVAIPLHLVFTKPLGRLPLHSSFLIGGSVGWNTVSTPEDISLFRERWSLDVGIGIDIRQGNWHIRPEVVSSHGMNNIHNYGSGNYDFLVGKMVRDRISLKILIWKRGKEL